MGHEYVEQADELDAGGRELWDSAIGERPDMPDHQRAILLEACRTKDRIDTITRGLNFEGTPGNQWSILKSVPLPNADGVIEIRIDSAVSLAKGLGETMAKHLATLRLTATVAGAKGSKGGNPGGTRAAYQPGVSHIQRARSQAG